MKIINACVLLTFGIISLAAQSQKTIQRFDPILDNFLNVDAKLERLADGFKWTEGPIWVSELQALLFSDVPNNKIYAWSTQKGLQVFLAPSGYTGITPSAKKSGSNGLTLDDNNNLVICMQGDRRIARLEDWKTKRISTVVTKFKGNYFNSPNDLVYAKNGDLYFTDPDYGLKGKNDPFRELPYSGVFKYSPKGKLTVVIKDLTKPNGIAISNDQKTLYVTISDRAYPRIMAYDITAKGVKNPRVFFDGTALIDKNLGNFDGIKIHPSGAIFSTGPGGVLIFAPNGKHLGTIATGLRTANCAFDSNFEYLYMTAHRQLLRIKLQPITDE